MNDRVQRDRELVRRALGGETRAFGEIVEQYQRMVGSVAWRYGVQRDDVEDVVADVFLKTFRRLDRYRADHPFSTWLYRLAVNHVIDRSRRERRRPVTADLPDSLPDGSPSAGERAERDERARLVREALLDVPVRFRETLFLVYIEGLGVADAATMLGLPTGTVKSRLLRGRRALGRILARRHPEHFGESGASR